MTATSSFDSPLIQFILAHQDDDPARLLLSAEKWPEVDVRRAAQTIAARRKIKEKLPSWHAHPELEYPSGISLEQCSSETTALYKQAFVKPGSRIADLTGGLGVDFLALSARASEAHYCEQDEALCEAARHNFPIVMQGLRPRVKPGVTDDGKPGVTDDNKHGVTDDVMPDLIRHLHIHQGDGIQWLSQAPGKFDLVYLDPARRDKAARRVYDISDCEPDLLQAKPLLLDKASSVLAKISPMADISRTIAQLPEIRELHVLAAGGEVKELLLFMQPGKMETAPLIVAAEGSSRFCFRQEEEAVAEVRYAGRIGKYLLQPSKALRKAGAFRLLSQRFGIAKLAPSTHLYTADAPVEGFPGKCLEMEDVLDWNKASIKLLRERYGRAELSALNFPLSTEEFRSRSGIPGGGAHHIFATSLSNKNKILIICKI